MDNYERGKEMSELSDRGKAFRAAIAGFIDVRREAKLKDKEDDAEAASKYEYATWLADAARRVGKKRAATHVLKATHPDAKGSSLHVAPAYLPQHAEIGSHLLCSRYALDMEGNTATLDLLKLCMVEVDGKRLIEWMRAGDADLRDALSDDREQASGWMRTFASLVREEAQASTHPLAKQVYWLIGDEPGDDAQYQLLQPMFSSSLAHAVHADMEDARFGEVNKQARQAFRDQKPADLLYREYRNLMVRKLGGTKPQNISQRNIERRGVNYLLASLPPIAWKSREFANLLKRDSILGSQHTALLYFGEIRSVTHELADFLKSNPEANEDTRNRVKRLAQAVASGLVDFGVAVRGSRQPGWTRDPECSFPLCEKLWLDSERRDLSVRDDPEHPHWNDDDVIFNDAYDRGEWVDEVAERFGRWLNQQLRDRSDTLAMLGKSEARYFTKTLIRDTAWPFPGKQNAKAGVA